MNDSPTSKPLAYSAETIAAGLRALCKCTPPYRCCLLCQGAEHLERRLTEVYFACGHTVAHEEACPRCQIERLRAALEAVRQYGADTLTGRADGPDDRDWQRGAVLEMTKRARKALGAAHETPAVTVDVPKLQTDLELAHAAINRVYTGRVRDMLRLLSDNEISSARAHEWLSAFVRDGVDRPMPGDAVKTAAETPACNHDAADPKATPKAITGGGHRYECPICGPTIEGDRVGDKTKASP